MKNYICILGLIFASALSIFANEKNISTVEKQIPSALQKARWVWPYPFINYDIVNAYALFRESVELKDEPKKATVYITADKSYMLYVNGELVARGPARGYQNSWPYDEVDITKFLKKGKNIFAIRAYSAGRSTFSYLSAGVAGVLYAFDIDGKIIASRKGTKCMRQDSCDRDTVAASMQLDNQEHIDMRLEPIGWKNVDFDDSKWGKSEAARLYNAMPYFTLEEREVPMLEFKMLPSPKLVAEGVGKVGSSEERIRNNFSLLDIENATIQEVKKALPIIVKANKDDEFSTYILDFGREIVGSPILTVSGAKGGEIIDILFDEYLNEKFEPAHSHKAHCKPALGVRTICREGDFSHEFYQYYGFRFAIVKVRKNSADFKFDLRVRSTLYPMQVKGVFKTSNNLLNKIWSASVYTQQICSLDVYVDTPWREQAQWWGDARVHAFNTFFISGDTRLLSRGIRIIQAQKEPSGLTYGHAPTIAYHCIMADYSLIWIATLYDYYWQTGSNEMYVKYKDTVESILAFFDRSTDTKTGLVVKDPRYNVFFDWAKLQKTGQPAMISLYRLYALQLLTRMCRETGLDTDAQKYAERAEKVKLAIEKNLLDNGLIIEGILPDGTKSSKKIIHNQVLAQMTNISGFDFEKAKNEMLLPYLRGEFTSEEFLKSEPSSFWSVYLLQTMIDAGHSKEVIDFVKTRWAKMAEWGTTFEQYNGRASRSHAWTAHPAFILPHALSGIKQTSAGWKSFEIKPNYLVDEAEILHPTPVGEIKVSWKKKTDGTFETKIDNPLKK